MYEQAKHLLDSHNDTLMHKAVLETWIASLLAALETSGDDMIESMNFARPIDGLPLNRGTARQGGKTEYIALNRARIAQDETDGTLRALRAARDELARIDIRLGLYDAVLLSLTDAERNFVRLHYADRLSIQRISELHLVPNVSSLLSASTLRRMDRAILHRIDHCIANVAPSLDLGFDLSGNPHALSFS